MTEKKPVVNFVNAICGSGKSHRLKEFILSFNREAVPEKVLNRSTNPRFSRAVQARTKSFENPKSSHLR